MPGRGANISAVQPFAHITPYQVDQPYLPIHVQVGPLAQVKPMVGAVVLERSVGRRVCGVVEE